MDRSEPVVPRIVIVGGGASGLELATRLGNTVGRRRQASVALVERERTHLWKPLLHQAAAGTLGVDEAELDHLAQASRHPYSYRLGAMDGIDRARRLVRIAPTRADAARLQRRVLDAHIAARTQAGPLRPSQLEIVIVGGGATGVELAAELHRATQALARYGLDRGRRASGVHVTVLEAASRLLPPLPPRLSAAAAAELQRLGVSVRTGQRVDEVRADGVATAGGDFHPAEIIVWAAGIRAPGLLRELDGLELDRQGRLVVRDTLQTTRDDAAYAIGDCAACPWPGHDAAVPPRTRAAAAPGRATAAAHVVRARASRAPGLLAAVAPPPVHRARLAAHAVADAGAAHRAARGPARQAALSAARRRRRAKKCQAESLAKGG